MSEEGGQKSGGGSLKKVSSTASCVALLRREEDERAEHALAQRLKANNMFPDSFTSRPEFQGLWNLPITDVAKLKLETEAYLALEVGVDAAKDSRYFQTPSDVTEKYNQHLEARKEAEKSMKRLQSLKPLSKSSLMRSKTMASLHTRQSSRASSLHSKESSREAQKRIVKKKPRQTQHMLHGEHQRKVGNKSSNVLTKAMQQGELLLEKILALRAKSLGMEDASTKEAVDNLIKCYLAQRKKKEAKELEENPHAFAQKLLDEGVLSRSTSPKSATTGLQKIGSPKASSNQENHELHSPTALPSTPKLLLENREEQSKQAQVELTDDHYDVDDMEEEEEDIQWKKMAMAHGEVYTSSPMPLFCRDLKHLSQDTKETEGKSTKFRLRTIYPKWEEFRAHAQVQFLGEPSIVLRESFEVSYRYEHKDEPLRKHGALDRIGIIRAIEPKTQQEGHDNESPLSREVSQEQVVCLKDLPDANEGVVSFDGSEFDVAGTYYAVYLIHGSMHSIGEPAGFEITHVSVQLEWEEEGLEEVFCGQDLRIKYLMGIKEHRRDNFFQDWLVLFREECPSANVAEKSLPQFGSQVCMDDFAGMRILEQPIGHSVSGVVHFDAASGIRELLPGKYIVRSFCKSQGNTVYTGASKPLFVRLKIDKDRLHRIKVDRFIRICLISPAKDLTMERMKLKSGLEEFMQDFSRENGITFSIVDMADFLHGDDLDWTDRCTIWYAETGNQKSKKLVQPEVRRARRLEALFHEIENCRPTLIFLFADRYGLQFCTPPSVRLVQLMPWLRSCLETERPSVFDLATRFGWFFPIAQGEDALRDGVLFAKRHPVCKGDDPLVAEDRHESPPDQNFDGILKLEERIWESGATFNNSFSSNKELVEFCCGGLEERLQSIFRTTQTEEGEEVDAKGNEKLSKAVAVDVHAMPWCSIAHDIRAYYVKDSSYSKRVLESMLSFTETPGLQSKCWKYRQLLQKQVDRLEAEGIRWMLLDSKTEKDECVEDILSRSLFIKELDPEFQEHISVVPRKFLFGTPLALVAPKWFGKTSIVVDFMEMLARRHAVEKAGSRRKEQDTMVHRLKLHGKVVLAIGVLISGYSRYRKLDNILEYVIQTALDEFGEEVTRRLSFGKANTSQKLGMLLEELRQLGHGMVLVLDNIDDLETKTGTPLESLPLDIDPSVLRLIVTMRPESKSYLFAKKKLWNNILVGRNQLTIFKDRESKDFTSEGLVSFAEMEALVGGVARCFEQKFGNLIDAKVKALFQRNPMWWTYHRTSKSDKLGRTTSESVTEEMLEGRNPSVRVKDSSIGRLVLLLEMANEGFLEEDELLRVGTFTTDTLFILAVKRFCSMYRLASPFLQILSKSAKTLHEREIEAVFQLQKEPFEWDAVEYSIVRRVSLRLFCHGFGGRICFRNYKDRFKVAEVLKDTPSIQFSVLAIQGVMEDLHGATGKKKTPSSRGSVCVSHARPGLFFT